MAASRQGASEFRMSRSRQWRTRNGHSNPFLFSLGPLGRCFGTQHHPPFRPLLILLWALSLVPFWWVVEIWKFCASGDPAALQGLRPAREVPETSRRVPAVQGTSTIHQRFQWRQLRRSTETTAEASTCFTYTLPNYQRQEEPLPPLRYGIAQKWNASRAVCTA